ncbi:MAG: hypothetical protein WCQ70_01685 [Lentimicrobiaceae bacterium]
MHLYRFRLLFEEQDDFLRDYDILASQTFLDLHNLIVETVGLKGNELASFFICDRNWRKKREITLMDMQPAEEDKPVYEDEDDEEQSQRKKSLPSIEMGKVKIKELIDDPHQRLLYEYNFLNPTAFYIELMKIINADTIEGYPKCVKSQGVIAPPPDLIMPLITEESDEVTLPDEFDSITQNDDDLIIDNSTEMGKEW